MPTPQPRTHVLVVSLICAVVVGGIAIYAYGNRGSQPDISPDVSVSTPPDTTSMSTTTNSDWKKAFLYATTSGDVSVAPLKSASGEPFSNPTATELFNYQLFQSYMDLKQNGLSQNPDAINALSSDILSQDLVGTDKPKVFTLNDIAVTSAIGPQAAKDYGNAVGYILKTYTPAGNDVQIVADAMKSGDTSYTVTLKANIGKYQTMITKLKAVPTPDAVKGSHLNLLNGVSDLSFVASTLILKDSDPVKAMAGLSVFNTATDYIFTGIKGIKDYLRANTVSFVPAEAGSFFDLTK